MLEMDKWQAVNNSSTGYLGKLRNSEWAKRDVTYGPGNWIMGWLVDGKYLEYHDVCQLYGNAYYEYFKMRPELLEYLLKIASDVYDDDPANVEAGTDFGQRGVLKTHVHDTAIRRSVGRMGRQFMGPDLFRIGHFNNEHPLAVALSPGQVPFHRSDMISNPDNLDEIIKDAWWLPGSVEDFYQRNKRLCVKKKKGLTI